MSARGSGRGMGESVIGAGSSLFGVRVVLLIVVAAAGGPRSAPSWPPTPQSFAIACANATTSWRCRTVSAWSHGNPIPASAILQIRDGAVSINGEEADRPRAARSARLRRRSRAARHLPRGRGAAAAAGRRRACPPPRRHAPAPAPPATSVPRRARRQDESSASAATCASSATCWSSDEVVVVMGSARSTAKLHGEVIVVMGSLTLGPEAVVHGEVHVVGGALNRSPTARIDGAVHNVGGGGCRRDLGGLGNAVRDAFAWRVGGLAATLRVVVHGLLLTLVVVAFGPGRRRTDRRPHGRRSAARRVDWILCRAAVLSLAGVTVLCWQSRSSGFHCWSWCPSGFFWLCSSCWSGSRAWPTRSAGRCTHALAGAGAGAYATVALGVIVIGGLTVLARSAALHRWRISLALRSPRSATSSNMWPGRSDSVRRFSCGSAAGAASCTCLHCRRCFVRLTVSVEPMLLPPIG